MVPRGSWLVGCLDAYRARLVWSEAYGGWEPGGRDRGIAFGCFGRSASMGAVRTGGWGVVVFVVEGVARCSGAMVSRVWWRFSVDDRRPPPAPGCVASVMAVLVVVAGAFRGGSRRVWRGGRVADERHTHADGCPAVCPAATGRVADECHTHADKEGARGVLGGC